MQTDIPIPIEQAGALEAPAGADAMNFAKLPP